jgi:hypothetical protein
MKSSNGFTRFAIGELCGCIFAIDGWVSQTRKPYQSEGVDVGIP